MKLVNDSLEHRLTLRLKKDIKREYAFRLFLDTNSEYGINRKELVLQMYEILLSNGFIDKELMLKHVPITSSDTVNDIIKQNENSFNDSIKKEKQSEIDEVNGEDFQTI